MANQLAKSTGSRDLDSGEAVLSHTLSTFDDSVGHDLNLRLSASSLTSSGEQTLTATATIDGAPHGSPITMTVADGVTTLSETIKLPGAPAGALVVTVESDNSSDTAVSVTATLDDPQALVTEARLREQLKGAWLLSADYPCGDDFALNEAGYELGAHIDIDSAGVGANRDRLTFSGSQRAFIEHYDHNSDYDHLNFIDSRFTVSFVGMVSSDVLSHFWNYAKESVSSHERVFQVYYDAADNKVKALLDDGPSTTLIVGPEVSLSTEFVCTLRWDGTTAFLTVDGETFTEAFSGPLDEVTSGDRSRIGQSWDGSASLTGSVRRMFVWRRFLSDAEVAYVDDARFLPGQPRGAANLVILDGQSNANGDGAPSSNLTTALDTDRLARSPVIVADGRASGDDGNWRPAIDGLGESSNLGSEIGMAMTLGEMLPGMTVIAKYAENGTNLHTDWQTGDSTHTAALAHFTGVADELANMGYSLGSVVEVGVRGEADSSDSENAGAYAANLATYVGTLEAALGRRILTVQSRLSDSQAAHPAYTELATTQAQQDYYASLDPLRNTVVNTDRLNVVGGGNTNHFDADGQLENGLQLGEAAAYSILYAPRPLLTVHGARLAATQPDYAPATAAALTTAAASLESLHAQTQASVGVVDGIVDGIAAKLPAGDRNMAGAGDTATDLDDVSLATTGGPVINGDSHAPYLLPMGRRTNGWFKSQRPARIAVGETPLLVADYSKWGDIKFTAAEEPTSSNEAVATVGTTAGTTYGLKLREGTPSVVVTPASGASAGDTCTVTCWATAGGQRIKTTFDVVIVAGAD